MGKLWVNTQSAIVFVTFAIYCTYGLQVEFFESKNYKDFSEGIEKKPGDDMNCFTLDKSLRIQSMKTDKCLMMYNSKDCKRERNTECAGNGNDDSCPSTSYRVGVNVPEFHISASYKPWTNFRVVRSFHVCSQERGGGPSLDLDYYDAPNLEFGTGKLVREWREVCTCQNIPKDIRGGSSHKISVDNHGNDIGVFTEENCEGKEVVLHAGVSLDTRRILINDKGKDIASFRPAGNLDCIKLDAQIFKFHFTNGTDKPPGEKDKLVATGEIFNDGPVETSEEYLVSEKVTETVEYSIAEGYTEMQSAGTEVNVEISAEVGVPLVGKSEVSSSIAANYECSREDTNSSTTTHTASKETLVQVTKRVTVGACTACNISAYVKQLTNFPIAYDSYSKISGYAGKTRLKADEIKAHLPPGVDYVRDVDEFTVEAITQGIMYAEYGVKTLMEVKCNPIPDCVSDSKNEEPSTVDYEFPIEEDDEGNLKLTYKRSTEIGSSMGIEDNWNSLTEVSFAA